MRTRPSDAKVIRSRANPLYKLLSKLGDSARDRRREGLALLDGVHLVETYFEQAGAPRVIAVSADAVNTPEIKGLMARISLPEAVILDARLFREITPVTSPSGIIAVIPISYPGATPDDVECCVLLEDIQDPGNLGSVLRTAAAAGVRHALLSKSCADAWSPRVLRGAMGAHHLLAIEERADLVKFARAYRGRVVAAEPSGRSSIYDLDFRGPTAFALGNEGAGLTPALRRAAHVVAAVPMAEGVESLNVGAAAAICLFERVRQLSATGKEHKTLSS